MGNTSTSHSESENQNVENNQTVPITHTWNGALSYSSTQSALVDLFFKSVRTIDCIDYRSVKVQCKSERSCNNNTLEKLFDKAYEEDRVRALKFLFYLRDCRGGKGEKRLFRALVRHLRFKDRKFLEHNIQNIPTFGSWKDLTLCFFGTELEQDAVQLIATQLVSDMKSDHPSLCAKYAPTEGGAFDREHKAATKISKEMGLSLVKYRKQCLTPLRAKLNIVEREMCSNNWNEIDYQKVPSIAGTRYTKAFRKHDEERYNEYLNKVVRGEAKMNTSVLMPYQIVAPYLNHSRGHHIHPKRDDHVEAQWTSFIQDRRGKWKSNVNILPLVDVSGSMSTSDSPNPMQVAVSLGLLLAELNQSEQYHGKFITFHTTPQLLKIEGDSLCEQVTSMHNTPWGGSTDVQAAFDLILNAATMFNVKQEDMPQILLILSDMQFNQAHPQHTNWQIIEDKFTAHGYVRPTLIFWNLSGKTTDYPVPSAEVPNCMLLSGYNDSFLYSIMDLKMPNPLEVVRASLDAERYNCVITEYE
jgi:hypothetical protein